MEATAKGALPGQDNLRWQLLQTACAEAEVLESALKSVMDNSKSSQASMPSHFGSMLLKEHTRLSELRKMKEVQISKLVDSLNVNAPAQQQASFDAMDRIPTKKRRFSLEDGDNESPLPVLDKTNSDANKEAAIAAPPHGFFTFGNSGFPKPPFSFGGTTSGPSSEPPSWQQPRTLGAFS